MADMYNLRLIKYGNISDAIEYMRENKITDDEVLTRIVMNNDVAEQDQSIVEKIILQDIPEFNKHFKLEVDYVESGKKFTKPFDRDNNIKQLLLYTSLTYYQTEKDKLANVGLSLSSSKSASTTMRFVERIENKVKKPFWEFNSDDIKLTYVEMAKEGYTPHTIVSKISLLIKMLNCLELLASLNPKISIEISSESEWHRAVHSPAKKKPAHQVVHRVKRQFYTKDIIYKALNSDEPRNSVIALLIYRGVKFPARDDPSDNEMGSVKIGDFTGNVLTIHGNYPRTISFTDYEMEFIRDLMGEEEKFEYLFRPDRDANKSRPHEPLKRWALSQKRLKHVEEVMGIPMNYYPIRQSGELEFIDSYLRENKDDPDFKAKDNREQLIAALIKCFEQYGIAKKGELTTKDFGRGKNQERLHTLALLKKQYDFAVKKREDKKSKEQNKTEVKA